MKILLNQLLSMKLLAVLFAVLASASAVATFIENDFGTQAAWAAVYSSLWFEVLIALMFVSLIGNIFKFKMYKKDKLGMFIFHLSLIFVIIGAAATRYFGFEGVMHIREAKSANYMLSNDTFLTAKIKQNEKEIKKSYKVLFSSVTNNNFVKNISTPNGDIVIKYIDFYQNAAEVTKKSIDGEPYISLIIANGNSQPEDIDLFYGDSVNLGDAILTFGDGYSFGSKQLKIYLEDGKLFFKYPETVESISMDTKESMVNENNSSHLFESRNLYTFGNTKIVLKSFISSAKKTIVNVKNKTGISALMVNVTYQNETQKITLFGAKGVDGDGQIFKLKDTEISLHYGAKRIELPFFVKLDSFIMQKYPGSMSPSSYESHVTVIDPINNKTFPFHIYMNHILTYKGFRFYQSSYDKDEQGTILSVAHDPGIFPTYFGYFLMTLGLFMTLLAKKGRFRKLAASINKNSAVLVGIVSLLLISPELRANDFNGKFGQLLVQDNSGRIMPMDTMSMRLLNKIHRSSSFEGKNYNEVVSQMITTPNEWQNKPFIKVSNSGINKLLGVDESNKYLAFSDFFTDKMEYKLANKVNEVSRKKPADRDPLDKEILKVDERVNISFMLYRGELFKVFPIPNNSNGKWVGPIEAMQTFPVMLQPKIKKMTLDLINSVSKKDFNSANKAIFEISKFQHRYGKNAIPNQSIIDMEILFNHLNIFYRLAPYYGIIGFVLLVLLFSVIFKPTLNVSIPLNIGFVLLIILFIMHTFGLGLRWYISGHAPWSNGYESMIYISWSVVLAGLLFSKKTPIALAATSILSALILLVAHLSWMDPQITNLVPVLKSYWLTIHVSVISASYGFLALSSLVGFLTMILFILRDSSKPNIDHSISELSKLNEMSMLAGVATISIGNMFGAVWANESWGRYWSWDAKETWTLVSIMIYAAIVHLKYIPKLNTKYLFALLSTIAFGSIIMTYFGVNYFLSGMHSYAAGDPMPIPNFVYYTVVVVFVIGFFASFKRDSILKLNI